MKQTIETLRDILAIEEITTKDTETIRALKKTIGILTKLDRTVPKSPEELQKQVLLFTRGVKEND